MTSEHPIHVTPEKINSADFLYRQARGWVLTDSILDQFRQERQPDTDIEVVRVKARVLNELYSAGLNRKRNVVEQMAERIVDVMSRRSLAGPPLVRMISEFPDGGSTIRHYRSFASKYCHFYVNPEQYPILDSYSLHSLVEHLCDREYSAAALHRDYGVVLRGLERLRERDPVNVPWRTLDHCLYLRALWGAYEHPEAQKPLARDVKNLFDRGRQDRRIREAIDVLTS